MRVSDTIMKKWGVTSSSTSIAAISDDREKCHDVTSETTALRGNSSRVHL